MYTLFSFCSYIKYIWVLVQSVKSAATSPLLPYSIFFSYTITFIWLWNLDTETKVYKNTKDNKDEIHEMQNRN
jgi:hypothetical protein